MRAALVEQHVVRANAETIEGVKVVRERYFTGRVALGNNAPPQKLNAVKVAPPEVEAAKYLKL